MKRNSTGGMQTSAIQSDYCPKCHKTFGRMWEKGDLEIYLHLSRAGVFYHIKNKNSGEWQMKKKLAKEI